MLISPMAVLRQLCPERSHKGNIRRNDVTFFNDKQKTVFFPLLIKHEHRRWREKPTGTFLENRVWPIVARPVSYSNEERAKRPWNLGRG